MSISRIAMKLLIIALLAALSAMSARCQVTGTVTLIPHSSVKKMIGGRTANGVSIWVVNIGNSTPDTVMISEAAVMRVVPQLQPFDDAAMLQLLADGAQFGWLERTVRGLGDLGSIAGFLGTGQVLPMTKALAAALSGANFAIPAAITQLKGIEVGILQNYIKLNTWPMVLAAGGAGTAHIFSAPWATPKGGQTGFTITLSPSNSGNLKLVQ